MDSEAMNSNGNGERSKNIDKSARWVKYRCVKRAVDLHMKPICADESSCINIQKRHKSDVEIGLDVTVDDSNGSNSCLPLLQGNDKTCGNTSCSDGNEAHNACDNCVQDPLKVYGETSSCFSTDCIDITAEVDNVDMVEDSEVDSDINSGNESALTEHEKAVNDDELVVGSQPCLTHELADWAVKHNVSHVCVSDLLKVLAKYHDLPRDARTLLKSSSQQSILPMKDMLNGPGEYAYFGIEKQILKSLFNVVVESRLDKLELFFNIDGLPLFKSSSKQLWPILCAASVDGLLTKPFAVAIFCGNSKPVSADIFLHDFVEELHLLLQTGICFGDLAVGISVKGFICDAPARAFIKCIKGHTGYYGCEKCVDRGRYVSNRLTYPNLDACKRSDLSFIQQTQEEHHKGVSPLTRLNIGLVSQVPLEYMHLICLGAMRKLLLHWLRGERSVRISMQMASLISDNILELKQHICCEFQRKPRALSEIDRWKAVEFRLFLCYTGLVVLRGKLPDDLYHHFMLLHAAIIMLLDPLTALQKCDDADKLLREFALQLYELYGADSLVYTMHNLIHVADDVRRFGALDSYSAFAFENELGQLKRLLRSGKDPLRQLCRRLTEQWSSQERSDKTRSSLPVLTGVHSAGPTYGVQGVQYCKMHYLGYTFSCNNVADCYALLECGSVLKIENFIDGNNDIAIVGHIFAEYRSFYSYPCDSQLLNTFKLSRLSNEAFIGHHTDIVRKCLLIPRKNYFISIPLLHVAYNNGI